MDQKQVRQLADKARAYASSELYPAVVGGLVVYSLLEYTDSGRWIDAHTMATAVIEHAEAAGWRATLNEQSWWEVKQPPTIGVSRAADENLWNVVADEGRTVYATTWNVRLLEDIRDSARETGVVHVHYRDHNSITARMARQEASGS